MSLLVNGGCGWHTQCATATAAASAAAAIKGEGGQTRGCVRKQMTIALCITNTMVCLSLWVGVLAAAAAAATTFRAVVPLLRTRHVVTASVAAVSSCHRDSSQRLGSLV